MSNFNSDTIKTPASVIGAGVFILLSLAGLLSIGVSAASQAPPGQKYALLIGINNYEGNSRFRSLEGTHNDMALIKDILMRRFEMPEENIMVLLDENATHEGIRNEFERLAAAVKKGDVVYIHYSGHGSYTCDLNGDEETVWGRDSTWVCYGARQKAVKPKTGGKAEDCAAMRESARQNPSLAARFADPKLLNEFDILDDEIHAWLAALHRKTEQVIFVSDSCHSGTTMRDRFPLKNRGLPMDMRPHPLGAKPPAEALMTGLQVTACRDDESAHETEDKKGKTVYDLFTYSWAESLNLAQPGETWNDVYLRARAMTTSSRGRQHPRIQGQSEQVVFSGAFKKRPHTATVFYVGKDGKTARINQGALLGITVGSVFRKDTSGSETQERATLKITDTNMFKSYGYVTGVLKIGDRLVLEKYQYNLTPLKVFAQAELPGDKPLQTAVTQAIAKLPAFAMTDELQESDFRLAIIRPRQNADGGYVYADTDDPLPGSFADRPPECWITSRDQRLLQDNLRISMADPDKGARLICENLNRVVKVRHILTLDAPDQKGDPIAMRLTLWRAAADTFTGDTVKAGDKRWRKIRTVNGTDSTLHKAQKGDMLTFEIENRTDKPYYLYLVNITSDSAVRPFYPKKYQSVEHGQISAGAVHGMKKFRPLVLEQPREYIRMIACQKPIDIYVLEQEGFQMRAEQGPLNPLERLLGIKAGYLRTKSQTVEAAYWTTVLSAFSVAQ